MTETMIREAYSRMRTIDQTIPDEVLDFMKDAAIEKLMIMKQREAEKKPICQTCGMIPKWDITLTD